jgi:antitoxin component YwqK of YwqJK toxin-antitoxin module
VNLTGPCIFYYPNGQIKERGLYTKNVRNGKWEYFYDNGQKAKTIIFTDHGAAAAGVLYYAMGRSSPKKAMAGLKELC